MPPIRALASRNYSALHGQAATRVNHNSKADATLGIISRSSARVTHVSQYPPAPHAASGPEAGYLHYETQWAIPDVRAFSSMSNPAPSASHSAHLSLFPGFAVFTQLPWTETRGVALICETEAPGFARGLRGNGLPWPRRSL